MTHITPAACARGCRTPDGKRPVPAIGKSKLCGACHQKFARAVNELGDLWPIMLGSQVRSSTPATSGRVQSSNQVEAGSEWRPAVTGALDEIREWALYMRRMTDADPRNHVPVWPTDTRIILYGIGHPRAAHYLTHVHDMAPSFVDDALRLRHRATAVLNSDYVRRYPLGATCTQPVYDDDQEERVCGGQLVGTIEPADSGRDSAIRCSTHPAHRVPVQQWAQLQEYLEELRTDG